MERVKDEEDKERIARQDVIATKKKRLKEVRDLCNLHGLPDYSTQP